MSHKLYYVITSQLLFIFFYLFFHVTDITLSQNSMFQWRNKIFVIFLHSPDS